MQRFQWVRGKALLLRTKIARLPKRKRKMYFSLAIARPDLPKTRMWPFRRKPLLEPEMAEWMFEQAEWLLTAHAHRAAFASASMLPLAEKVFPASGPRDHAFAEQIFAQVLDYAGADHLSIRLSPSDEGGRYRQSGAGPAVKPQATAAGRYWSSDREIEIEYDVSLLTVTADLVAVLAHEVAHAVLDLGAKRPPPGDSEFEEMRTDFTACFLGFGLYLAQYRGDRRIDSKETADAFKSLYIYYMNLPELCFSTALFCAVREVDKDLVLRGAPWAAVSPLKRAFADIEAEPARLQQLRAAATGARHRLRIVSSGDG